MKHSQTDRIHFRDNAIQDSSATVLIHGWGVSSGIWDDFLPHWPKSAGRLILPELAGSGWSPSSSKGHTVEQHAEDLLDLIRKLNLAKVKLVGNSMGGVIALWMGLAAPELISKIILVNPVPPSGLPLPPEYIELFRAACSRRESRLQLMTAAMAKVPSPEILDRLMIDAATVRHSAALESFESFRSMAFSDRIGDLKPKVTLVSGAADPFMPVQFLEQRVLSRIQGAQAHWISGAGHYPQVECPREFAEALIRNLS